MLWIVTSQAGLNSAYGADGAALVEAKLQQLAAAAAGAAQGAELHVLAASNDAPSLYAELKALTGRSVAGPGNLLIAGDQRIFPSFSVSNPVTARTLDPDTAVVTDNPYGSFVWSQPVDAVLPEIPVGRIAAGVEQTAAGLAALLDAQIALRTAHGLRTGYVEIVSRQWQNVGTSVLSMTAPGARVIVSPDGRVSASNASLLDCKYLYCNLHGFLNTAAWSGYDQGLSYPVVAITPDAFQPQYVSGTVTFTEACYGLATSGRTTGGSNALSLMAAGAAAVIGSTGLAYGSATAQPQTLIDADILARTFFNAAAAGVALGHCLSEARSALRSSSSASDAYVVKTLLEFQLLGDPSYVLS